MAHFRRKPWDVDAWRLPMSETELLGFAGEAGITFSRREDGFALEATIVTQEGDSPRKHGTKLVRQGDWIIRTGKGVLSSMSDEEFQANFDYVDEDQDIALRRDLGLRPDLREKGQLIAGRYIRVVAPGPVSQVMDVYAPSAAPIVAAPAVEAVGKAGDHRR